MMDEYNKNKNKHKHKHKHEQKNECSPPISPAVLILLPYSSGSRL